jgi:MFS family permease
MTQKQAGATAPTGEQPPEQRKPRWSGLGRRAHLAMWPEWMTRDIRLLIVARVCMSATRALAGVLVPIYLALIGYSAVRLGLLFTAVALTSAGLSTLVGLLSDRLGRKPFIVALPLLTALAGLAFAFSHTEALLFLFAALGTFGRGAGAGAGAIGPYQPAEQAFLADSVPARFRNTMFGRVAFASSLGALIGGGPLAALPDVLPHLTRLSGLAAYRVSFVVLAGLACAAGLLALPIANPRPRSAARRSADPLPPGATRRGWLNISHQSWPILLRLWTTNSVNGLAVGFFGPFITYWFYRRYGVGPATIGALYAVINLAAMISNLQAARIARRLGLVRAIVFSRTLQAVLIIPMVLAPAFWIAGAVYLVRMLAQRVGLPLRQSYVMAVVPAEERGSVGALANLPSQGTSAASPTLAGYLVAHVALALPFEVGAALQGLNTLLFFLFFRKLLPPEERATSDDGQGRTKTA